jgi:hypothetical protein
VDPDRLGERKDPLEDDDGLDRERSLGVRLVGATTCTENGVPTGTWKYTLTPAAGAWRGIEGAMSATITVLI